MTIDLEQNPAVHLPVSKTAREGWGAVRLIGLIIVVALVVASGLSFLVLLGFTPIEPERQIVRISLAVNGLLIILLFIAIGLEILPIVRARRQRRAAARLHIRIVALFAFVAAVPAIVLAMVAGITLDRGLDRWFAERTQAIIDTSRLVAQAYVQESLRLLRSELVGMAVDLEGAQPVYVSNIDAFQRLLNNQARIRGFPSAKIVANDGSVILSSRHLLSNAVPPPPQSALQDALSGDAIVIAPGGTNLVGGVKRLEGYNDLYLYVVRSVDPRVTRYVYLTDQNAEEYKALQANRFGTQIAFALLFVAIAAIMVMLSMWLGINLANRLVAPIRTLISAARDVSDGKLNTRVEIAGNAGDLTNLGTTFNRMIDQLKTQRDELMATSDEMDRRRRFTEAVLSGVTAGVAGLDSEGRIKLLNPSAAHYLELDAQEAIGQKMPDLVEDLRPFLERALVDGRTSAQDQLLIHRDGFDRTMVVRLTRERSHGNEDGYVLTLDDISDLVTAQRTSAWADVARRIAHEIKNPLTPIQLSAERLRRRYGKVIVEDRTVFDKCIDTIVRQVGDIGRMVDEFSSFARMPKPVFEDSDLTEIVKQNVFLLETGHPEITFRTSLPDEPVIGRFDPRQISQAFTNILKNASEAAGTGTGDHRVSGRISVSVSREGDVVHILVDDNGSGFPSGEDRARLLEPYMTTREKGTGLGLAIVRKIMEDHGGGIHLGDAPADGEFGGGARVELWFRTHHGDDDADNNGYTGADRPVRSGDRE